MVQARSKSVFYLLVNFEASCGNGVVGFIDRRVGGAPAQGELTAVGGTNSSGGAVVLGEQLAPRLAEPGAAEAVGQGDRGCRLVEAEILRSLIVGGQRAGPGKGVEQPQRGCAGAVMAGGIDDDGAGAGAGSVMRDA